MVPQTMEAKDHARIYDQIGLQALYKFDKMNYSRQDIHLISTKIRHKMVENEKMLQAERRKNSELKG